MRMFYSINGIVFLFAQIYLPLNASEVVTDGQNINRARKVKPKDFNTVPIFDYQEIREDYKSAKMRYIFLDFDGVLGPKRPGSRDRQDKTVVRALRKLSANPNNKVWIITARYWEGLPDFIRNIPGIHLGEKVGTQIHVPKNEKIPKLPIFQEKKTLMKEKISKIFEELNLEGVEIEDEGNYHLEYKLKNSLPTEQANESAKDKLLRAMQVEDEKSQKNKEKDGFRNYDWHFYQKPGEDMCHVLLSHFDHFHKGTLMGAVLQTIKEKSLFAFSVGDTKEDEPMHELMQSNGKLSVIVGENCNWKTYASHKISNQKDVKYFLKYLSEIDNPVEDPEKTCGCFNF
ncbi:threalose-6-phosphate phosphatase [Puccinia graminis f. sp. tritici]|uniref:Threalose-6-phosphate phosphatase n=1 Tax=Puccinia graminis f. sp. tritici TaxID=56615 RepID=A0A5B0QDA1_PUCGR|nr:threalose-6-phosphate phosphatase [Puccinia graminis f. sp. tritici]